MKGLATGMIVSGLILAGTVIIASAIKDVKEEKKERRDVDTDNGRKTIVSIHLDLVEDQIPQRAERF